MMHNLSDGPRGLRRRLTAAVACVAAVAVWASGSSGFAAASVGETGSGEEDEADLGSLLTDDTPTAAVDDLVPHRISFDSAGSFSRLVEIEALMPEGVVVNGNEIDISELVANSAADPIVEGNPQWFISLEAIPRIGLDVRLEGTSVIEYTEANWGVNPELIDPVRVVEQGTRGTTVLPDGSELEGCDFVGRSTVGRHVATSFVEVAFDPDTCKRIVEFGVLADPPTAPSNTSPTGDRGQGSPPANTEPPSSSLPGASGPIDKSGLGSGSTGEFRLEVPDYRAKTRSQIRELAYPVLPATSEVNAQVEVWNQQPHYSPSKWRWWSHWLVASGWRRDSHDSWGGWSPNNIYVGEASDYSNNVFARTVCSRWDPTAHGTTYAGHNVQTIGYANMTVDHFVSNYKRGACSYLLRTNQTDNFWWINET